MKKLMRLLATVFMALGFCSFGLASAEAANVALLPLINNVAGDELAGQIYFKEALNTLNGQPGFMLVDNDQLTAVVEAEKIAKKVPDQATLARIADKGNVDIVISMQLDKLEDTALRSSEGDRLQLNLQGYAVAYNKLTGKYYKHRIYNDKIIPEAFSSRWDWTHEEWGYVVKAEVKRILEVKKVTLDAPRMSKL
ncbi:MAG: hypothetical protein ACI3WS_08470 [Phascolarctobacterium sp.]